MEDRRSLGLGTSSGDHIYKSARTGCHQANEGPNLEAKDVMACSAKKSFLLVPYTTDIHDVGGG